MELFLNNHNNFKVVKIDNFVPDLYIDKKGALFINPLQHKLDGIFAVKLKKSC